MSYDDEIRKLERERAMAREAASAREARKAEAKAKQEADAAERAKADNERRAKEVERRKRDARGVFRGTDEDFERLWPEIRDTMLVEQATAESDDAQRRQRGVIRRALSS